MSHFGQCIKASLSFCHNRLGSQSPHALLDQIQDTERMPVPIGVSFFKRFCCLALPGAPNCEPCLCFASKVQPRANFGEPRSASNANKHATFRGQHQYLPSKSDPCRSNTLTFEIDVHTTQEGFWSWRRKAIPLLGPCQRSAIVLFE